ncbi:MAG: hypothetical protein KJ042_02630 [Deltaproteobacteria bacterium]|nr:hypothetical protein [Deltaproteobacteria bacterium]
MRRWVLVFVLVASISALALACSKGGEDDRDLAPELFAESIRVYPNPAWLYEKALFYFGFEDFDGDMDNPTLIVRFEDEDGGSKVVEIASFDIEGETAGTVEFEIVVRDGDEGTYFVAIADDAGNLSNEIPVFLYVNPEPRDEENYFADDDEADDDSDDDAA